MDQIIYDRDLLLSRVKGDFVRETSWKWVADESIKPQSITDPYQICPLQVPHSSLYLPTTGGDPNGALAVSSSFTNALESTPPLHIRLHTALQEINNEIQPLLDNLTQTRVNSTSVPYEWILQSVTIMQYLSQNIESELAKLMEIKQNDRTNEIHSESWELKKLFDNKPGDVPLPIDHKELDEDMYGIKKGWVGNWWDHKRREEVERLLALRTSNWSIDEQRDENATKHVTTRYAQFNDLKTYVAVLERMGNAESVINIMAWLIYREIYYQNLIDQNDNIKSKVDQDINIIVQKLRDLIDQNNKDSEYFNSIIGPHEEKLKDCAINLNKNQNELKELDRRYDMRRRGLEGPGTSNEEALILYHEIEQLQANLEKAYETAENNWKAAQEKYKRELQEAEELKEKTIQDIKKKELEIDEATKRWQQREMWRLEDEYKQLDIWYNEEKDKLLKIRQTLEEELELLEKMRAGSDENELQRVRNLIVQLDSLQEHLAILNESAYNYNELLKYLKALSDALSRICCTTASYHCDIRTQCTAQMPDSVLLSLQNAAELSSLLDHLLADKQSRLSSVDETISLHNCLLEFCVDTQDPNAHKHEKVLIELNATRNQLDQDSEGHINLDKELKEQSLPLFRIAQTIDACLEPIWELKNRHPAFFAVLEPSQSAVVVQKSRPNKTLPSRSRFVFINPSRSSTSYDLITQEEVIPAWVGTPAKSVRPSSKASTNPQIEQNRMYPVSKNNYSTPATYPYSKAHKMDGQAANRKSNDDYSVPADQQTNVNYETIRAKQLQSEIENLRKQLKEMGSSVPASYSDHMALQLLDDINESRTPQTYDLASELLDNSPPQPTSPSRHKLNRSALLKAPIPIKYDSHRYYLEKGIGL